MSLPHYSPSEMKLLVKHLHPELLDNYSNLNDENRRFVGSVILTDQIGGNNQFDELQRGHDQIKMIAKNYSVVMIKLR